MDMKFVCGADVLNDGMRKVSGALPTRTVNQILEGVLVEAGDGAVKLTCSDERMTVVTSVPAEVDEPGRGVVPGRLFGEVVKRLSGGDVTVAMNKRFAFTVKGQGSRVNLSGQDGDLFPALPEVADERVVSMPQQMLKRMIEKVAYAVAVEDMREVLTGALLEFKDGRAVMVGLDGFRLAMCEAVTSNVIEDCSVVIPGRALSDIGRMLSDEPDAFVELRIGGGKLLVALDGAEVYATLIQGEYINYRGILPKAAQTEVTVAVRPLREAVERAALIARNGNNNLLVLKVSGDEMTVEAMSQVGDSFETLEVVKQGEDAQISFNVKYIQDALKNMDSDEIVMRMNGGIAPCVMTPVGDEGVLALVLPVRTAK